MPREVREMTTIKALLMADALLVALGTTGETMPEGNAYAAMMAHGCDLETFAAIVRSLSNVGMIERLPGPCLRATQRAVDLCAARRGRLS